MPEKQNPRLIRFTKADVWHASVDSVLRAFRRSVTDKGAQWTEGVDITGASPDGTIATKPNIVDPTTFKAVEPVLAAKLETLYQERLAKA